ncbi:hypothetical protein ACFL96_00080 [Thermoproteota archaeon]
MIDKKLLSAHSEPILCQVGAELSESKGSPVPGTKNFYDSVIPAMPEEPLPGLTLDDIPTELRKHAWLHHHIRSSLQERILWAGPDEKEYREIRLVGDSFFNRGMSGSCLLFSFFVYMSKNIIGFSLLDPDFQLEIMKIGHYYYNQTGKIKSSLPDIVLKPKGLTCFETTGNLIKNEGILCAVEDLAAVYSRHGTLGKVIITLYESGKIPRPAPAPHAFCLKSFGNLYFLYENHHTRPIIASGKTELNLALNYLLNFTNSVTRTISNRYPPR